MIGNQIKEDAECMTREDLKNYKYTQEWIKDRTEHIEEYKANITNITTTLSDMPKGSRKVEDSIAEKVATLLDDVNDILKVIVREEKKQKQITEQLNRVQQPYRMLLEKVYMQGKTLVTVADEMNYSYEYIKHMNGRALLKFDEASTK